MAIPAVTITMSTREVDRIKTVQAVVDPMTRASKAARSIRRTGKTWENYTLRRRR